MTRQALHSGRVCRPAKMSCTVLIIRCGFFLVFFTSVTASVQNPGVLDKIKTGLEYASSYIETAKEIANLVSKSLGHGDQKRGDDGERIGAIFGGKKSNTGTHGLVAAFFRLLGLDSSKMNAIAVNSAIFLAQMISTAFNLKPKIDKARDLDLESDDEEPLENENWAQGPMRFILGSTNEKIQRLVRQARDENLPTNLVDRVDGLDTACVRLLVCKASPVIRAAQRSLNNDTGRGRAKWDITSWLPTREEFQQNGDNCEENHEDCRLFND